MGTTEIIDAADAVIVLPANPGATERLAGRELTDAVAAIAGVRLPLRRGASGNGRFRILLGNGSMNAETSGELPRLAEDEIQFARQDSRTIILRGGGPRGMFFAVYEWLDQLGCRWFHPRHCIQARYRLLRRGRARRFHLYRCLYRPICRRSLRTRLSLSCSLRRSMEIHPL